MKGTIIMHFDAFLQTLPIMLYGMLGIFVVMGLIFLTITVLQKVFGGKSE
jgi:hypothetical protein